MIDPAYFWVNIVFLSSGTLAIRGSFIFMSGQFRISPRLRSIFAYIPAAILPALIAPMVFYHQGVVEALWGKERFIVLILSSVVCYLTKSMLATVGFGLSALYVASFVFN